MLDRRNHDLHQPESELIMIENGKRVSIELTMALDDGTTAIDKRPLVYRHGNGNILPALERAMAGLEVDDTKEVTLPPEDAYGSVDSEAFWAVNAEGIPADRRKVGAVLTARGNGEARRLVRVHEVHDEMVVLDFNHPLAGQSLHFAVHVTAIE
jgi:FKBP-type peptidyl-prolyl cis-trans isomerase 2